jgi:CBS domain-containing protein
MANDVDFLGAAPGARFVFYSSLHGRPVLDATGTEVGRLDDLAVELTEGFPPVVALVARRGRIESFPLTARWRDVETIDERVVRLRVPVDRLVPGRRLPSERAFWMRLTLLDRQIVDTAGAKVVRVNDVELLQVPTGDLHLVHVEVGLRGLVRRLGWSEVVDGVVRRLSPHARYLAADRLISWRYVQPLALDVAGGAVQLTVARRQLRQLHPAQLADILNELDGRERESLFRALEPRSAALALTEVEPRVRVGLIASVPPERAADILEHMPPDEAADLLATLPAPSSHLLLGKMEREEAEDVEELLRYEPDTAGGMMTTELVTLPGTLAAGEAFARLRELARNVELLYYVYVVDPAERLEGVLTLRHLLLAPADTPLADLMHRDPVSVRPDDTPERVAEVTEKYNLLAVPVLDAHGRLRGVVTVDDVLTRMTALAWKWKTAPAR